MECQVLENLDVILHTESISLAVIMTVAQRGILCLVETGNIVFELLRSAIYVQGIVLQAGTASEERFHSVVVLIMSGISQVAFRTALHDIAVLSDKVEFSL